ncbi:MAG: hypothetical protein PHT69_04515 [Bacteroidales bacterium]|nr:hypothetical protein [Bacteroidales bacterium]
MKTISIILISLLTLSLCAQDTTNLFVNYDGSESFTITTQNDTMLVWVYPNGKKESVFAFIGGESSGVYTRWYDNGRPMWVKNIENSKENGLSTYYSSNGERVASFNYNNGLIVDTVYVKRGTHIVLGKILSTSKVYGGAVREDGSSNISEYSGPYAHCAMYAAIVDSVKTPEFISRFKTDYNGDFFLIVPEGSISFFPEEINIEMVPPGEFYIPPSISGSTSIAWKEMSPLNVGIGTSVHHVELQHSSVGYAP